MKKIILIAALFIGFLGINEVKAESRVRVVCENSANMKMGYRNCIIKANLDEETTKITMDYNFENGVSLTESTSSNEEEGWKLVAPTTAGQNGKLTFENKSSRSGETTLGTIGLLINDSGRKMLSFTNINLSGTNEVSLVDFSYNIEIDESTNGNLVYLELDGEEIELKDKNIILNTNKEKIMINALSKLGTTLSGDLGQKSLKEGENIFNIVVTNDTTNEKETYTLKITRLVEKKVVNENTKKTSSNEIKNPETNDMIIMYITSALIILSVVLLIRKKLLNLN